MPIYAPLSQFGIVSSPYGVGESVSFPYGVGLDIVSYTASRVGLASSVAMS